MTRSKLFVLAALCLAYTGLTPGSAFAFGGVGGFEPPPLILTVPDPDGDGGSSPPAVSSSWQSVFPTRTH